MASPRTRPTVSPVRLRSIHAVVQMMNSVDPAPAESVERKRRLVADLCRILGERLDGAAPSPPSRGADLTEPAGTVGAPSAPADPPAVPLSPRMRQTLERLLAGDSEKEIASRLRLSRHTVHVYVKTMYRRFGVSSRGELFARFIDRRAAGTG